MRYAILAAVAAFVLAFAGISTAQDPNPTTEPVVTPTPTPQPKPKTYWQKNGCKKKVDQREYTRALHNVYAFSHKGGKGGNYVAAKVTSKERRKLERKRECSYNKKAHKNRLKQTRERRKRWAFYAYIDRVTDHGEWAIPAGVPYRESGTSGWYRAYNDPPDGCSGNGCIGAYQIDASWFNRGCARFLRYGSVWTPAVQHLCADYIERVQGPSAWAATW